MLEKRNWSSEKSYFRMEKSNTIIDDKDNIANLKSISYSEGIKNAEHKAKTPSLLTRMK